MTFNLDNLSQSPTVDIFVGSNIVEPMGLQSVQPQPLQTRLVTGGTIMTIAVPPGTHDAKLRLMLQPLSLGFNELMLSEAAMPHNVGRNSCCHERNHPGCFCLLHLATGRAAHWRRMASMMTPFDIVVLFLFGGALMSAVLGDDHSMVAPSARCFQLA